MWPAGALTRTDAFLTIPVDHGRSRQVVHERCTGPTYSPTSWTVARSVIVFSILSRPPSASRRCGNAPSSTSPTRWSSSALGRPSCRPTRASPTTRTFDSARPGLRLRYCTTETSRRSCAAAGRLNRTRHGRRRRPLLRSRMAQADAIPSLHLPELEKGQASSTHGRRSSRAHHDDAPGGASLRPAVQLERSRRSAAHRCVLGIRRGLDGGSTRVANERA
jgi:hypothetical protein